MQEGIDETSFIYKVQAHHAERKRKRRGDVKIEVV
jgi:hypothetical protein